MTPSNTSKILTGNLFALHKDREAVVSCKHSEKIQRVLSNNIRTSGDTKYVPGKSVYLKRANDKRWKRPGKVLKQDRRQVLVKYGSHYVRVQPCRFLLTRSTNIRNNNTNNKVETNEIEEVKHKQSRSNNIIPNDEDSEDEPEPEQQHEVSNIQDIDTLSTSLERLSVSNTRLLPLENDQVLRRSDNIRFKLKGINEWKTATLISRSGKATGKYKKEWNSKLDDGTKESIDYERE